MALMVGRTPRNRAGSRQLARVSVERLTWPQKPIDPRKAERFATFVGFGSMQHEAAQAVGVHAPQ